MNDSWIICIILSIIISPFLLFLFRNEDKDADVEFRYYKIIRKKKGYYLQIRKITCRTYKDKLIFETGPFYRSEQAHNIGEKILDSIKNERKKWI